MSPERCFSLTLSGDTFLTRWNVTTVQSIPKDKDDIDIQCPTNSSPKQILLPTSIYIWSGPLGVIWFKSFQKYQIWPRWCPCHIFSISADCQDGWPMGPPYWQNPIWPPLVAKINASLKTICDKITHDTSFWGFWGQGIRLWCYFDDMRHILPFKLSLNSFIGHILCFYCLGIDRSG